MNKKHISHAGYLKRNAIQGVPSKVLKIFGFFNGLKTIFRKSSVTPTDLPPPNMQMAVKTHLLKAELRKAEALNQIRVQMIR